MRGNGAYSVSPRAKEFKVGDYVFCKEHREGYIRYIGTREFHHGIWYGIELMIGRGPHDGSEHGKRYFSAKSGRGIFVRSQSIKKRADRSAVDPRRQHKLKPLALLPQSTTLSDAGHSPSPSPIPSSHSRSPSPRGSRSSRPTSTRSQRSNPNHRQYNLHSASAVPVRVRMSDLSA